MSDSLHSLQPVSFGHKAFDSSTSAKKGFSLYTMEEVLQPFQKDASGKFASQTALKGRLPRVASSLQSIASSLLSLQIARYCASRLVGM